MAAGHVSENGLLIDQSASNDAVSYWVLHDVESQVASLRRQLRLPTNQWVISFNTNQADGLIGVCMSSVTCLQQTKEDKFWIHHQTSKEEFNLLKRQGIDTNLNVSGQNAIFGTLTVNMAN